MCLYRFGDEGGQKGIGHIEGKESESVKEGVEAGTRNGAGRVEVQEPEMKPGM